MPFLYAIITSLVLVFLESFFTAFCGFKLFFVLAICMYKKINWKYILIIVAITSIILDITAHYLLGTNLLIMGVLFLIIILVSLIVPLENSFAGYSIKFLLIFAYYICISTVPELLLTGSFGFLTWGIVGSSVVKAIISVLLCFVFDTIWTRVRNRESGNKIRRL